MADIVDSATRSRMMGSIRSRNTTPELLLRRALHAAGFRFRVHVKELPGRPDIVLPRWKAVIQVHGCFWHRHRDCRYATTPSTRGDFWLAKFESNVARDEKHLSALRSQGWRTAVVWECALRSEPDEAADAIATWLKSDADRLEIGDQLKAR